MPLGLWKSKWEISREEWQAESRDLRRHSDELREECKSLRVDYDREVAETRLFNRELLIRLEKSQARVASALEALEEQLQANTDAVKAQTEAIFRLVDRFEEADGRPPV